MTQVVFNRKHLEAKAVLAFTEFRQLARRTIGQAWQCGQALSALKDATEHGAWIPWLEANEISEPIVQRLMRLHCAYPETEEIKAFDSVDAALKAIPKPQKEAGETDEPRPLTAHEKWLVERDELMKENHQLTNDLINATQKAGDLKNTTDYVEELNVDVAKKQQEEIRQLNQRIDNLKEENRLLTNESDLELADLKKRREEVHKLKVCIDDLQERIEVVKEESLQLLSENQDLRELVQKRDGQLAAALRNEPQVEPEPTAADRSDGIPF